MIGALLIGAALRVDALRTGFYTDDYQQLALLRGEFLLKRPVWDAYWFGPGNQAERERMLDFGFEPWWTAPDHTIAMFRPLSSVLLWLDLRAFGSEALGYHLHALSWWALLIVAAWALLFRVLPAPAAALALLFFAVDQSHDTPLCWIANRGALIAVSLGLLALLAQQRAFERDAPHWLWLAALGWSCALAAGEYAFGIVAYGIAHAWLAQRATSSAFASNSVSARLRRRALLAAALPACAYLVVRAALGHGVTASGLYVSPGDPLRYLVTAPPRWLALAGELVLDLPAAQLWTGTPLRDTLLRSGWFATAQWLELPTWAALHALIGAGALVLVALALRWLARRDAPELAALRWLIAGSAFALLSVGAALPESRLLISAELGACALLGTLVLHAARALRERRSLPLALVVAALVLVHGPLAARASYLDARGREQRARATRRAALAADLPERVSAVDVVLISAGDFSAAGALPWIRRLHGLPLPRSYRRLSGTAAPHWVRRSDAQTLVLTPIGLPHDAFTGSLYRPRSQPFAGLQRVQLRGMDVQVLALSKGEVARFAVRFDRPLESPSLLFLQAAQGGLRRWSPPPVGAEVTLPRAFAAWE